MLKRMFLFTLLSLLVAGTSLADDGGSDKQVKVVKHVVVKADGGSGEEQEITVEVLGDGTPGVVTALGGHDQLAAAGEKLLAMISELNGSGDLSDAGAEKLQALVEEIGHSMKAVHGAGLARVIRLDGSEAALQGAHKAYAIALKQAEGACEDSGEACEITVELLADAETQAAAEGGAARAFKVLVDTDGAELEKKIMLQLDSDEGGAPRILKMETDDSGNWVVENEGFPEELVEKLKQQHGGNVDVRVFKAGDADAVGKVYKLGGGDGGEMTWLGGGDASFLGAEHEHQLQEWFEKWDGIVESMAGKLDASDIDKIHGQLSWLKDHLAEMQGQPRMMMLGAPDWHEMNPGVLEELKGKVWFKDHQELFDKDMLREHHGQLIEELKQLVEELVEQKLREHEQKSGE